MKWFKHYSDALDDPFISDLMDEFGHTGYVIWFGLLEIIAKESGAELTGKLDISPAYLRRKLRVSSTKLRQVLAYCGEVSKLSVTFTEKTWSFDCPKIVELKDNYTKDLQATGKKPSKQKEKEKEKEEEEPKAAPDGGVIVTDLNEQSKDKVSNLLEQLDPIMAKVQAKYSNYNPYAFMTSKMNQQPRPLEVWIDLFERLLQAEDVKDPWAWAESVYKVEAQNTEARLSQAEAAKFKGNMWSVKDILKGAMP